MSCVCVLVTTTIRLLALVVAESNETSFSIALFMDDGRTAVMVKQCHFLWLTHFQQWNSVFGTVNV